MKVLKFGGSSVGTAESIEKVIEIVRATADETACAGAGADVTAAGVFA